MAGNTADAGPYAYQLNSPTSVTCDPYGYLFVLDSGNSRVQKWFPRATYGVTVASSSMSSPLSMKIDPRGNVVVLDTSFHRVLLFAMTCRKNDLHLLPIAHLLQFISFSITNDNHDCSTKFVQSSVKSQDLSVSSSHLNSSNANSGVSHRSMESNLLHLGRFDVHCGVDNNIVV